MKILRIIFTLFAIILLTGCGRYVVQVDLTPEQRAEHEAIIAEYTAKLKNWDPVAEKIAWEAKQTDEQKSGNSASGDASSGTPVIDKINVATQTPHGLVSVATDVVEVETSRFFDKRPPFAYFMKIAQAQEDLGYLSDSLNTYKKGMSIYENSQVAWNNMGRLAERMGRLNEAVGYYQRILDQFGFTQYYLDIANIYVRKGDLEKAQKTYNQFRLLTNQSDIGLEGAIQDLREKNNEKQN